MKIGTSSTMVAGFAFGQRMRRLVNSSITRSSTGGWTSPKIRSATWQYLISWFDTSIDWDSPTEWLWSDEDLLPFRQAAAKGLELLQVELPLPQWEGRVPGGGVAGR